VRIYPSFQAKGWQIKILELDLSLNETGSGEILFGSYENELP
jgi:hypothetical protein